MSMRRPRDPPIVDIRDRPPESRSGRAREELDREVADREAPVDGVVEDPKGTGRYRTSDDAAGEPGI